MGALREEAERGQQPIDLVGIVRMAEDRQAESRLGDEDVAGHRLERRAGRVGAALVVARDDDPGAVMLQHDLGAAQHMAGRSQPELDRAERQALAIAERLQAAARCVAEAHPHDRQGTRRRQHPLMAGPRMVAMAVADHRPVDRPARIDVETAGLAIETLRPDLEPLLGTGW